VDDAESMGTVLAGIELITHCMTRCLIYERLYIKPEIRGQILDEATILESSLKTLYTKILVYLSEACLTFAKNTACWYCLYF
jgi:hypothetical protein